MSLRRHTTFSSTQAEAQPRPVPINAVLLAGIQNAHIMAKRTRGEEEEEEEEENGAEGGSNGVKRCPRCKQNDEDAEAMRCGNSGYPWEHTHNEGCNYGPSLSSGAAGSSTDPLPGGDNDSEAGSSNAPDPMLTWLSLTPQQREEHRKRQARSKFMRNMEGAGHQEFVMEYDSEMQNSTDYSDYAVGGADQDSYEVYSTYDLNDYYLEPDTESDPESDPESDLDLSDHGSQYKAEQEEANARRFREIVYGRSSPNSQAEPEEDDTDSQATEENEENDIDSQATEENEENEIDSQATEWDYDLNPGGPAAPLPHTPDYVNYDEKNRTPEGWPSGIRCKICNMIWTTEGTPLGGRSSWSNDGGANSNKPCYGSNMPLAPLD